MLAGWPGPLSFRMLRVPLSWPFFHGCKSTANQLHLFFLSKPVPGSVQPSLPSSKQPAHVSRISQEPWLESSCKLNAPLQTIRPHFLFPISTSKCNVSSSLTSTRHVSRPKLLQCQVSPQNGLDFLFSSVATSQMEDSFLGRA